jgi:hypothetical protein
MDWWIVLGVAPSASKDEIVRKYRHKIRHNTLTVADLPRSCFSLRKNKQSIECSMAQRCTRGNVPRNCVTVETDAVLPLAMQSSD